LIIDLKRKANGELKHLKLYYERGEYSKGIESNPDFRKQRDGSFNFPLNWRLVEHLLEQFDVTLKDQALKWFNEIQKKKEKLKLIYDKNRIPQQDKHLYDFQTVDVEMLKNMKRVINGNDMGLGKTIEVISALKEIKAKKVLIVAPASLKYNWGKEINKFSDFSYVTTDYKQMKYRKEELTKDVEIYIVNYEMVRKDKYPELFNTKYDVIVADEAHKLKNPSTKAVKGFMELNSEYLWLLTGTAITNTMEDLWGLLHILDEKMFTNKFNFIEQFCITTFNPFGRAPLIVGNKNTEELQSILSLYMFRREKENTLSLPDKIYQDIYVKLEGKQKKIYDDLEKQSWTEFSNGELYKIDNAISLLLRLRQTTLNPSIIGGKDESVKTSTLLDILEDTNKQVIIFSWFKGYIDILYNKLKDKGYSISKMTGDTPHKDRRKAVDNFVNGKNQLFLATIESAGVGLNLQNASTVIFMDKPYSPHLVKQAEDRVYRNGQKNKVHIISIIAENTVDEDIERILKRKQDNISEVIAVREIFENIVERLKTYKED
jgi:SNF2 family DNA or RNA helicase